MQILLLTISILSINIQSSCTTERIITKTEYIKPQILPLRIFQRPVDTKQCSYDLDNRMTLIEAYEREIKLFNDSLQEYYKETVKP